MRVHDTHRDPYRDEGEPLPTDGLEVEEARDVDTIRRFMLEWRRRVDREAAARARARSQADRLRAMIH